MRTILLFLALTSILSCDQKDCRESQWKIVYKHDSNGEAIMGDKSLLIDAARQGYPIRIGFGGRRATDTLKSIEHIADVEFISIANSEEVFGQISSFFGQTPHLNSDTLRVDLKSENKWTVILGTNGERSSLSRHFDHRETEKSRRSNRGATWYAKLPYDFEREKSVPVW